MSSPDQIALGPVMLDVGGTTLTPGDREMLRHPSVGGIILFGRNYDSPGQLRELTAEVHRLRNPPLLIAVDQEGGRVQRFCDGFTRIPPMRSMGELWDRDAEKAQGEARRWGSVIAGELRAHGVDFSFAPVLDLDYGTSEVIGDRAFHRNHGAVATLAAALIDGFHSAGMAAVGKHFPGHGFVAADSHAQLPVDERSYDEIAEADLETFAVLARSGQLDAVMPAHVVYPAVDSLPAGFSAVWLQEVLRHEIGFDGLVVSDDLSMSGAAVAGGVIERAKAAQTAGCDVLLLCNDRAAAAVLLEHWTPAAGLHLARRLEHMRGR